MAGSSTAGKSGAAAQGGGFGQTALAFGLAALVAAGIGAAQSLLAPPPRALASATDAPKADVSRSARESGAVEMGALDLPPVVTNIAAPPDVWVRIEGTIVFEGKALPHAEALAGEIAGDMLAFMRTQTLTQIQGAAGLQHLRQDLAERIATRSDGRVREFIIKSLVVQ
jgi:flagellar protein FliL